MTSNRNAWQVVLSLVPRSLSQPLSIFIYTVSCYSTASRGVLIREVIAKEEWLTAHTEVPAAVIAAVFQFTNAIRHM